MVGRTAGCLLALMTGLCAASANYEYRFLEGESFVRGETQGLREEGFTSWMRHPSGGKVAVFGRPAGGWLEYDIKDLGPGKYWLYVRCLDIPTTRTTVLWDGQALGPVVHDGRASTSLRWCQPLGPITGGGSHVLRLQGGADATQWPYIDTLLLTNQSGYVPPQEDADFASFTTAWPQLNLTAKDGPQTIAPLPGGTAQPAAVTITGLNMAPPIIGKNRLTATVTQEGPPAEVTVTAAFTGGEAVAATLKTAGGALTLEPVTMRAGAGELRLGLQVGGQPVATGAFPVTVANPASFALDEYAYPNSQARGRLEGQLSCSRDLLPKLTVQIQLRSLEPERKLSQQTVRAASRLSVNLEVGKLPLGRYELLADLNLGPETIQHERLVFSRFPASPFATWEPVKESKSSGGAILVNGKPFLALGVYHTMANAEVAARGFNWVQCWGADPDPLPGIQQHLDACARFKVYGSVALFNTAFVIKDKQFDLANLEKIITRFRNHPALLCWDVIDEPDGQGMPPEEVKKAADLIRRLDPNHFLWVNLCQYPKALDYQDSQDLWSFDTYPFPTLTAAAYRTWLQISDEKLLSRKPLGTCLQTYVYNRHQQRMPTCDELRTSAWLHLLHGYSWFGCYSYYDGEPAGGLYNTPVLWSYARALNTELQSLREVLLTPARWEPLTTEPANPNVEAGLKRVGGKRYVVVVNLGREPVTVAVHPGLSQFTSRLLFESGEVGQPATEILAYLRPSGTRVFEVTP